LAAVAEVFPDIVAQRARNLSAGTSSVTRQWEATVSRQATRYLCSVVILAFGGYLIWLGDDWRIRTTAAHYVGYLIVAIGVAGLLGLNIWHGGPLDRRRDADAAGNTLREGIPRARLIMTAIATFAGIVSFVYLFVPIVDTAQDDLKIGKYRITADFPCRPKWRKEVVGKMDTGEEVSQAALICSQGDITYSLSATEYPEQAIKSLPSDAWLNRSIDSVRSHPQYTLESSTRQAHQTFPAMRTHFSDSRAPPVDMARLFVMTDAGMIVIGASWPSGSPEPSRATNFTGSLRIGEK